MNKLYTMLSFAVLTLSAAAQGPKPGVHARVGSTPHQRGGGAPANDECAGAIALTVGATCTTTAGSSADATQSMAPATDCGTTFISPDAFDVWYSFVATSDYTTIDVTGIQTYDAALEVFSGPCADLVKIGCADENFPDLEQDPIIDMTESFTGATTIGGTYYVRVYYYSFPLPETFDFTICAYQGEAPPPPPANDNCVDAVDQALAVGSTITLTGNSENATADDPNVDANMVWHSFTTTECADVTLNFCVEGSEFGFFFVNISTDCADFVNTALAGLSDNCSVHFLGLPAGTYLVPIVNDPANNPNEYTVEVSAASCDAYCTAGSDGCDEFAAAVEFGTISNESDCGITYQNFTAVSTSVQREVPMDITVSNNPDPDAQYPEDQCAVWIDWNQNNSLEDAGESFTLTSADEGASFTGTITAPASALLGATRMRVRLCFEGDVLPCGIAEFGDVEDYTVIVEEGTGIRTLSATNWSTFPNPTNGDITITGRELTGSTLVELTDMTGRVVYDERHTMTQGQNTTLHLGGKLATGTYTLTLMNAEGRSARRVIVK